MPNTKLAVSKNDDEILQFTVSSTDPELFCKISDYIRTIKETKEVEPSPQLLLETENF